MTVAIFLVILGSVAHAAWNLLAKAGTEDSQAFTLAYSLVVWLICLVPSAVALWSAGRPGSGVLTAAILGIGSGLLHAAYAVALQRAYTSADMSLVYPIARGLGPVLAVLGGWALLGDPAHGSSLVGLGLVLVGIAISATDAHGGWRGLTSGAIVGAAIGAYTLWDQMSVERFGADPWLYYFFTVSFQVAALLAVTGRRALPRAWAATKRMPRVVLGGGILVPVSYMTVLFAMTMAPLSVVAPLRATSVVIGAVGASLIYREQGLARRLVAAGVVCVGVAVVSTI